MVVELDAGGEREEAGRDPRPEVAGGAGSVAFEAEEVFAGEEDRFDSLPDRRQLNAAVGLVLAGGSHDQAAESR